MIYIKKGSEPKALTEYKQKGGKNFSTLPKEVKEKIYEALLQKQGHLCAYCMKRIPDDSEDAKSKNPKGIQIEHIEPQTLNHARELDYSNMVAVCPGLTDGENHCDASREEKTILTLNPHNPALEQTITYSYSDGTIKSSNPFWNIDLTKKDRLNLNHSSLKKARVSALEGVIKAINTTKKDKSWNSIMIQKKLDLYNDTSISHKQQYLGIIRCFLKQRLKRAK